MASLQEQLSRLSTKEDMIKWLVNEYYFMTRKIYGEGVADNNTQAIVNKCNVLISDEEQKKTHDININIKLSLRDLEILTREDIRKTIRANL